MNNDVSCSDTLQAEIGFGSGLLISPTRRARLGSRMARTREFRGPQPFRALQLHYNVVIIQSSLRRMCLAKLVHMASKLWLNGRWRKLFVRDATIESASATTT